MIRSTDSNISDQYLLEQMKNDDESAFHLLYDKYWEQAYNAAYKRLKDADYAKDITQDIFLQLWSRRYDLQVASVPAYLYTAIRNNVFKWMEKEQRFTTIPDLLDILVQERDQADVELLRKEFMQKYEALVDSLPSAQRTIFKLRFNEDLSTKEIAEKLDITRKTVQNQLGKSVNQLRDSLDLLYIVVLLHLGK
ncbi:MAG: sigma-70 family RNA polymerase sigma factor [Pedobacter sp.]|uniref:RNA polymerase sigma factor n=1 Tax=Pedobacter sp. TaxID=1411316 RepID=UPI00280A3261|nr:sigma-70 family RNA polymerase sigma factor [Pedobacter sp.]MDQ8005888.1 sigma-70 family RNA polymerase sigma factor [Pedobacter sp.]